MGARGTRRGAPCIRSAAGGRVSFADHTLFTMPKSPTPRATNRTLRDMHAALSEDLVRLEAQLPENIEGLSDGFERYAQIISLLVRSMEILMRQDDKLQQQMANAQASSQRRDLVEEIERALDRLASGLAEKKVSGRSG